LHLDFVGPTPHSCYFTILDLISCISLHPNEWWYTLYNHSSYGPFPNKCFQKEFIPFQQLLMFKSIYIWSRATRDKQLIVSTKLVTSRTFSWTGNGNFNQSNQNSLISFQFHIPSFSILSLRAKLALFHIFCISEEWRTLALWLTACVQSTNKAFHLHFQLLASFQKFEIEKRN
jgi:hypothetical protein